MEKIVIKGRGAVEGRVEGYALVCPNSIAGWGGIDPVTGIIKDYENVNKGECIKDTILVIPGSKGSNGWSCYFSITRVSRTGPKGLIITTIDSSSAVAAVGMDVPAIVDFPKGQDPCVVIKNGDYVVMDGKSGEVTILRNNEEG